MRTSTRQRGRSSSDQATTISRPAMAACGISARTGLLTSTSKTSSKAANTAAIGVRAPAS
ncbi:Uncharacterised protein [Bordetella pertussis]|nr:Uncharacterised protein [Bordetella pertussis]CFW03210.1 Uncharacterised protein [Bordetella pertussis]